MPRHSLSVALLAWALLAGAPARANPPVAVYLFPAGGQRGTTVDLKVGGLFLHQSCGFEMLGTGVTAPARLVRTRTLWFEGPRLPLPESQQAEDYPQNVAGKITIAADAPLGPRHARLWTAEGAAGGLLFEVGDLPEIVEQETDGDALPVEVHLPVTINGRIFPRGNVDVWSFQGRPGHAVTCTVRAARLGSPLDAQVQVLDPQGRVVAASTGADGPDPVVHFVPAVEGRYQVRLQDNNGQGGPAYVYRLTLTADAYLDRVFPLGGQRGSRTRFDLVGTHLPATTEVTLPADGGDFVYRSGDGPRLSNGVVLDVDDLPEFREAGPDDPPAAERIIPLPAVVNGRIGRPGAVSDWRFAARKGETLLLELRAAQLGSPLQGVLTVEDATGRELGRAEPAGGQLDPQLSFTVPADGTYRVSVRDRFRSRGGPAFAYRLRLAPPLPGFRLRVASDSLTLLRGGQAKLRVLAERQGGWNEAISLTVEGLPKGVTVTGTTLAAGQNQVDLTFAAGADAVIGPSRLSVRGTTSRGWRTLQATASLVGPRGFPALSTLLLGVALPAPFRLVADYDLGTAPRGSVYRRRYRIERQGFDGPLEIRLADRQARHLQGVTGPTLTIPAGVNSFDYPITLPPWMETGRTCRVCVMAVGVVKEGAAAYEVSFSAIGQNDQIITVIETGRLGIETSRGSVAVTPGGSATVEVKVVRARGLTGPVRVQLILPEHVHGVRAEPLQLAADQQRSVLTLRFASDHAGPFNVPALIRATLDSPDGPVVAETHVDLVP
jgi:hypothetical protein